ncbi:MAG TPA: BrnA antitoxin family protein [Gammaproteobacteria bacterium]|nr:BrnA antitoxin family protein [Gammaproteobacteria bacterium]
MADHKPLIDENGEVRELTEEEAGHLRPADEALPDSLKRKLGVRGPQKSPTKERITIRLSPEVVQAFRSTGNGWQGRLDAALADWLEEHSPEEVQDGQK